MKKTGLQITTLAIVFFALALTAPAQTPLGTAFTYQGQLRDGGSPANGTYDLTFALYDQSAGGTQQGSTVCADNVALAEGLFTLELDFGAQFTADQRFLEIAVRADTGLDCGNLTGFVTLSPRQALTAAPYALALPGLYTQPNATSPNVIGGHSANSVVAGVVGATLGGGGYRSLGNVVTGDFGTVGGGYDNTASYTSSVVGGYDNEAGGDYSTVGGGYGHRASSHASTVGGGGSNMATGESSSVGGGWDNTASGSQSIVGGGRSNAASGEYSTVGGGISNTASVRGSTVGGGSVNTASGLASTVGGGDYNTASGYSSTVGGGFNNQAGGEYSFAAGQRAKVRDAAQSGDSDGDEGTFVWADSTAADFTSTGPDQFLIRASGGVGIGTNVPDTTLHVGTGADASLASGSGYLVLGSTAGANIVMDNDEIMARNNGAAASLYLNHEGGNVVIGATTGYSTLHVEGVADYSPFRVRIGNRTRLIFRENAGLTVGDGGEPPANGLRVAGDGNVLGTLTKGGGSFKIDHPLDPENYYLHHSFVESPDMMNIYNGIVVTDEHGYAVVELPDWFEALNRDFRYQLTVLDESEDEFVLAKVYRKIADNMFVIKTSLPTTEVSWQVTGIRKDAWAEHNRIPVEVEKEPEARGRYLHPEAFGLSEHDGISTTVEPDDRRPESR